MPIIVPTDENQDDHVQRPMSFAEKRRRDLDAAITMLELDDTHRRNIDDAAAKRAYVAYSDQAASLLHGDDGLMYRDGADAHAAFPATAAGLAEAHDQAIAPLSPTQRGIVAAALDDRLKQDLALASGHVREQGAIEQRRQSLALQRVAARDAVVSTTPTFTIITSPLVRTRSASKGGSMGCRIARWASNSPATRPAFMPTASWR